MWRQYSTKGNEMTQEHIEHLIRETQERQHRISEGVAEEGSCLEIERLRYISLAGILIEKLKKLEVDNDTSMPNDILEESVAIIKYVTEQEGSALNPFRKYSIFMHEESANYIDRSTLVRKTWLDKILDFFF